MEERVILVDMDDNEMGSMEKMEAHIKGEMHRAFSVFVFNSDKKLILQQRALSKYHSPGLWTNTCCSHPRQGESTKDAAHRRMREEMGFDTEINEVFSFTYKADVGQGLIEHEFDHVFFGSYDGDFRINTEEVAQWKVMDMDELSADIDNNPHDYTVWFKIAFNEVQNYFVKLIK